MSLYQQLFGQIDRRFMEEAPDDGVAGGGGAGDGDTKGGDDTKDAGKGGEGDENKDGDKSKKKMSDSEAKLLKEVMQKKEALKAAQEELNKLKAELKKFEGIDLNRVSELIKEADEAEKKRLEAKGEWDRLKAKMAEEHAKELKKLKEQLAERDEQLGKLSETIKGLTVGHAFAQSKFIAEELTLTPTKARIVYGDHFDVAEDGTVIAFDKPRGAADRTQLVNAEGKPLSFEEALRKLVENDPDRDHILRSKIKSGAGSEHNKDGKAPKKPTEEHGVHRIAKALSAQKK